MFKGTLRISGARIEMLQIDEFRRSTILAENNEFLAIKWPANPAVGRPLPAAAAPATRP